jgi:RNA polymerase sigma-70 factor, ECF subfamily
VPLILRYTEDLSYAEIAEVLSISVPAVKSRLFRARNMLAEKLEEAGERE